MKVQVQKIDKPWGHELIWAKTKDYVGKILFIKKGHQLSLQYHQIKEETVMVISGKMKLLIDTDAAELEEVIMVKGDVQHIRPLKKHRMIAVEDCEVAEVSTPHLDDVVRLQDSYGRTS